ncbi:MAG: hypothetical protein JSS49_30140 [Planctomycetes bacterium]|nr:hypothetical protein [Planctomycetota bacterium]
MAIVLLNLAGCGGGGEGDKFKGERGSVSGKVTYKGQAIPAHSTILFQSREGGYSAGGTIDDKGEYTLTYTGKSTMPAVEYKVQVGPPPPATTTTLMDPSKVGTGAPTEPPPPFPAKYSDHSTSGLAFTVKAGANKADFDLVD